VDSSCTRYLTFTNSTFCPQNVFCLDLRTNRDFFPTHWLVLLARRSVYCTVWATSSGILTRVFLVLLRLQANCAMVPTACFSCSPPDLIYHNKSPCFKVKVVNFGLRNLKFVNTSNTHNFRNILLFPAQSFVMSVCRGHTHTHTHTVLTITCSSAYLCSASFVRSSVSPPRPTGVFLLKPWTGTLLGNKRATRCNLKVMFRCTANFVLLVYNRLWGFVTIFLFV
jgi:hypothetical protein